MAALDHSQLAGRTALGAAARRRSIWPDVRAEEEAKAEREEAGVVVSVQTKARFASLPISDETKRAIEEMDMRFMTDVQKEAIPPILDGEDIVGRALTGTGKTLAFVIPVVEAIRHLQSVPGGSIHAAILVPTRELASQVAAVAESMLAHHPDHGVFKMMGTCEFEVEADALAQDMCSLIVATPGRFSEHLSRTPGFAEQLLDLKILVLDEADRLLGGFKKVLVKILEQLPPPSDRQGLFFSATFPADVSDLAQIALRPKYRVIDTVSEKDLIPPQISQKYSIVPVEKMTLILWATIEDLLARSREQKIMVFFTTARVTQYFAELFRRAGIPVMDLHSKKAQMKRFNSASSFWQAESGVFFTTDVSARGMDYPDVTAVVHFGAPSSQDRYLHRLGRSGRMGKIGTSILLLHDFEEYFVESLASFNVDDKPEPLLDLLEAAADVPETLTQPLDPLLTGQAYKAWLGYYNFFSETLGWDKDELVRQSTRFVVSLGALDAHGLPPPLKRRTAKKLGLENATGLNVQMRLPYLEDSHHYARNDKLREQELREQEPQDEASFYEEPVVFTGELGALFNQWDEEARERGLPALLPPKGFRAPVSQGSQGSRKQKRQRGKMQKPPRTRAPWEDRGNKDFQSKAPEVETVPDAVLDARLDAVARVMASRGGVGRR